MIATRPMVADHQFILATRDTGYRSLAAAVAELVDNAIQASAKDVRILVLDDQFAPLAGERLGRQPTIAVLDDGQGMDREGLWSAVQFGGTERFNDRAGLGRFGMGLPNSSVSVTRRLEVYSWQAPSNVLFTYLDIDEVSARVLRGVPEPVSRPLPLWTDGLRRPTGTLVVWPRCDRLDYKKASTIAEKLLRPLGRMYRHLIWNGVRIWVNNRPVAPFDPLFCHPGATDGGVPYGEPLSYEIALENMSHPSTIVVRFAELPVAGWHNWSIGEKRTRGVVGGAGASFVRAGREIDHGWYLFGAKRRENYDDWWRCEISFEPNLDELFGVTHSKQGVSPTAFLRSILEADLEATARALNARARTAFEAIKRGAPTHAAADASRRDHLLPPARHTRNAPIHGDGLSYTVVLSPLPSPEFFEVNAEQGAVRITINTDHPFYDRLYAPAAADAVGHQQYAIECLILAAGRAFLALPRSGGANWPRKYRESWSDALAAFLETKGAGR